MLTHVARNADSMTRVFTAGGETVERYLGGAAGRDAGIEAGASRPLDELRADVAQSADRLRAAWTDYEHWDSARSIESPDRTIPVTDLPMTRWREVEVHTVDLGLGARAGGVARVVRPAGAAHHGDALASPPPDGTDGLARCRVALDPPTRLAWLYGRTEIEGLAPRLAYRSCDAGVSARPRVSRCSSDCIRRMGGGGGRCRW